MNSRKVLAGSDGLMTTTMRGSIAAITGVKPLPSYGSDRTVWGNATVCADDANKYEYPSGGDLKTASAPMAPAAPGRFSTTTDWPTCSLTIGASLRAKTSVPMPAVKERIQ